MHSLPGFMTVAGLFFSLVPLNQGLSLNIIVRFLCKAAIIIHNITILSYHHNRGVLDVHDGLLVNSLTISSRGYLIA